MHTLCDFWTPIALDHRDVVLTLQIEPELSTIAEVAAEPRYRQ